MDDTNRVAIVTCSTRPTRICPGIAAWIHQALQDLQLPDGPAPAPIQYEPIDLAEVGLPLLDEPLMPALGQYAHEHTKMWSRLVDQYDGFLFVLPQYNWGYPAVLKNALDYLYREWNGKPVTFASYGTHGGTRAAEQLTTVLAGLRMRQLDDHLEIVITLDDVDSDWQIKDLGAVMDPYRDQLRRLDSQMRCALADPSTASGPAAPTST